MIPRRSEIGLGSSRLGASTANAGTPAGSLQLPLPVCRAALLTPEYPGEAFPSWLRTAQTEEFSCHLPVVSRFHDVQEGPAGKSWPLPLSMIGPTAIQF